MCFMYDVSNRIPRRESVTAVSESIFAGRKRVKNDAACGPEISDFTDRSTRVSPAYRPRFGDIEAMTRKRTNRASKEHGKGSVCRFSTEVLYVQEW